MSTEIIKIMDETDRQSILDDAKTYLDANLDSAVLRANFREYVAQEVAKRKEICPEFVETRSDFIDDTKLYILPDGYIYANYAGYNKDSAHNFIEGATLNEILTSDGLSEKNGVLTTGYIGMTWKDKMKPYQIHVSGCTINNIIEGAYGVYMHFYAEDKQLLLTSYGLAAGDSWLSFDEASNTYIIKVVAAAFTIPQISYPTYFRISVALNDGSTELSTEDLTGIAINCPSENYIKAFRSTGITIAPKKGTDFWTLDDKNDIINEVKDYVDGIVPTVESTTTENGHSITVTGVNGSQTFEVMNGEDGASIEIANIVDSDDGKSHTIHFSDGKQLTLADGYTPNMDEIVSAVLAALPKASDEGVTFGE